MAHKELKQPARDLGHLELPVLFQREGPMVTNVFFLPCPLIRKEDLQWKPKYNLMNYVFSFFCFAFSFFVVFIISL